MSYLSKLKNSNQENLRKLSEQVEKLSSGGDRNSDDDNFWKPTVDKAGNGSAIIRFLPPVESEDDLFVRYYDHGFQGPTGKYYIEKSLTTFGEKDPCGEYNSRLWRESDNDDSPQRKQARNQKRRLHFVSNILVVKDPGNPENNGKVFLFRYGKKIFDKWQEQVFPPMDELTGKPMWEACNPFDLFTGKDFYLRIRQVAGYRNYDQSSFGDIRQVLDTDSELEELLTKVHPLKPFIDPANYKSYAELEKRLNEVLGIGVAANNKSHDETEYRRAEAPAQKKTTNEFDLDDSIPFLEDKPSKSSSVFDDDDDDMAFFNRLRDDD